MNAHKDMGEKNKKSSTGDLFLPPMPTFSVFLQSFSELSISLSLTCEFRRTIVTFSRAALTYWETVLSFHSYNMLIVRADLKGS